MSSGSRDFPRGQGRLGLSVTISKGSRAHHAFMTTVIAAIILGLEPIVYLVGGVYAAAVYSGIVGTLRA